MKKIYFILLVFSSLLLINTSCKDDERVIDKGELKSATYDATTKTFKLIYSSGFDQSVNAIINNSINPPTASATLEDGSELIVNNANNSGEATITTPAELSANKYVNNWVYDQMSIYYLWNNKLPRTPNYSLYPEDFFETILYKYDKDTNIGGDRYSWIQEDYTELLKNLSGVTSDEIGFEYILVGTDNTFSQYYALVLYTMHGTDAEAKGVDRGRFITKINGQNITANNYKSLFSGTGVKNLSMADLVYSSATESYVLQKSEDLSIQMHSNYAENPVYLDSIYSIGDKKIGYLVYNFFSRDRGDNSYDYDKDLINKFNNFKSEGINEMVLDLRYNSGGAVSSAIILSSALVKNRSTENILTTSEYNYLLHNYILKEYGSSFIEDYFVDKIMGTSISVPELDLPRLYILTTGWTASASEFIINGLKPYMDVFLIGKTTYGKNVGSITIYEKDDPKNKWGMQPIVVKFANSVGYSDFMEGFTPDYLIDEININQKYLHDLGDINEPMLGKALSHITGNTNLTRSAGSISTPFKSSRINEKAFIENRENTHRFEMYDDIRDEEIRKIMNK